MTANRLVELRGSGIAASFCDILLARAGCEVRRKSKARPTVPAVLISEGTRALMHDVLGRDVLPRDGTRIRRRVVLWGPGACVVLPHSGTVISEQVLLDGLGSTDRYDEYPGTCDWTIHTGEPVPEGTLWRDFGARMTVATRVRMAPSADAEACLMESGSEGWWFLLPIADREAILLATGSDFATMMRESRLVSQSIDSLVEEVGRFPSHPRIADPPGSDHTLACGSAAMRFDPLCGDGAGHAVREAILACAVVGHTDAGTSMDQLLREYKLRLLRGFRRHLEQCLQFYSIGGETPWWQTQCVVLRSALTYFTESISDYGFGQFQLNGFVLERTPR